MRPRKLEYGETRCRSREAGIVFGEAMAGGLVGTIATMAVFYVFRRHIMRSSIGLALECLPKEAVGDAVARAMDAFLAWEEVETKPGVIEKRVALSARGKAVIDVIAPAMAAGMLRALKIKPPGGGKGGGPDLSALASQFLGGGDAGGGLGGIVQMFLGGGKGKGGSGPPQGGEGAWPPQGY